MKAILVSLAIAGTLVACSGDGPVSVAAQVELTQHEALWHQRGFHSYAFDLQLVQLATNGNFHVTVLADSIASVIDNATGMPPEFPVVPPTIDGLFTSANRAITLSDVNVELEFNDEIGYPTLYTASSKRGDPGGPYSAQISNFAAIH